ncbi:MAG: helix-turn-helix domain-containing protein [Clostridia bacterium]|nr:helix-turn-helix domain-containing protein [Clostridia bacterium]
MRDYAFGNMIAALRYKQGFSQFQLGKLVGVSDKAVSKWENGSSKPKMETCHKLARVLGITLDELLSPSDSPDIKSISPAPTGIHPDPVPFTEPSGGIALVPGCEIRVLPSSSSLMEDAVHVVLLAVSQAGIINLNHLLSESFTVGNDPIPYILKEEIESHREGILVGYCCFGVTLSHGGFQAESLCTWPALTRIDHAAGA